MEKVEVDDIIDSFTNPLLFRQDESGNFLRDSEGNLIRTYEVK